MFKERKKIRSSHRRRKSLFTIAFCIFGAILLFVGIYNFLDKSYGGDTSTNDESKTVQQAPAKNAPAKNAQKKTDTDITGSLNPKKNINVSVIEYIPEDVISQESETISNVPITTVLDSVAELVDVPRKFSSSITESEKEQNDDSDSTPEEIKPSIFYSVGSGLWNLGKAFATASHKVVTYPFTTTKVPPKVDEAPPINATPRTRTAAPVNLPAPTPKPEPVPLVHPDFFTTVIESDNVAGLKDRIRNKTANLNELNSHGYNALHYAAENLKIKVLKYLLESGSIPVDSVTKDEYGTTALHLVCTNEKPEALDAAKLLIKHKANVNSKDQSDKKATPIFYAADNGNEPVVKLLLVNGANANARFANTGSSVLHYAMFTCNRSILKLLLDYKADITVVNVFNRMPVHEAAAMGCVDGLKELIITRGVDQVTKDLRTPLESSQQCGNGYEYYCLFDATPLHFAAKEGKMGAVEFLLLIRAAYYLTDSTGRVPQDYANKTATSDVYNFIIDQRAWELKYNKEIYQQDVENLMRYCETLSPDDSYDYLNHLKRFYLHAHMNPVPEPDDDLDILRLTELELNFLKSNISGLENFQIADGGDDIFYEFIRLRYKNLSDENYRKIDFVPGLSKNLMKNIEAKFIRIKF